MLRTSCPHAARTDSSADSEPRPPPVVQFEAHIQDAAFPCVGARSALNKNRMRYGNYPALGEGSPEALCRDLGRFSDEFPDPGHLPVSFVATFEAAVDSEDDFDQRLWRQLQAMHDHDGAPWDATVSADPTRADFSFSVGGRAYFVVGMHPHASRLSRRTPMACLVFNFHNQFESLRESGKYASMQSVIRDRDIELQGSINPNLARFGEASEARQYSGRAVPDGWKCPFHA
jgi:FPC/CPF motif-containing protein YcgG